MPGATVVRPPSPELALKQQQAAVAAQNMYEALQRKERAAALEEELGGDRRVAHDVGDGGRRREDVVEEVERGEGEELRAEGFAVAAAAGSD